MGVMGTMPPLDEGDNRRSGRRRVRRKSRLQRVNRRHDFVLPVFRPGGMFFTGDSTRDKATAKSPSPQFETATPPFCNSFCTRAKRSRRRGGIRHALYGVRSRSGFEQGDADGDSGTNDYLKDIQGLEFKRAFTLSSIAWTFMSRRWSTDTRHSFDDPKAIFKKGTPAYWALTSKN